MWNNFTLLTKSGINVLLLPRTVLPKNWGQPTYSFVLTWYKTSFLKKKCLPPCWLTQQKIAFYKLKIRKTSRKLNFSLNYTRLLIMYLGGFDLWKKFPKIQILCLFKLNFQLFNPFAYIIICLLHFRKRGEWQEELFAHLIYYLSEKGGGGIPLWWHT